MQEKIRNRLQQMAEIKYRAFSAKLLPGVDNILGVRVPLLRKLAREVSRGDWQNYLAVTQDKYFEETMLRGMVIGYAECTLEKRLEYIKKFLPQINNWSVCDSFCTSLTFTIQHRPDMWCFIQPYIFSAHEYEVRFAAVMMLEYYIDETYINDVLAALDKIGHAGYYAKMAAAWAVSACYIKLPELTLPYLQNNKLDDFTYNKALQKITESLQVGEQEKNKIKKMKRKK